MAVLPICWTPMWVGHFCSSQWPLAEVKCWKYLILYKKACERTDLMILSNKIPNNTKPAIPTPNNTANIRKQNTFRHVILCFFVGASIFRCSPKNFWRILFAHCYQRWSIEIIPLWKILRNKNYARKNRETDFYLTILRIY